MPPSVASGTTCAAAPRMSSPADPSPLEPTACRCGSTFHSTSVDDKGMHVAPLHLPCFVVAWFPQMHNVCVCMQPVCGVRCVLQRPCRMCPSTFGFGWQTLPICAVSLAHRDDTEMRPHLHGCVAGGVVERSAAHPSGEHSGYAGPRALRRYVSMVPYPSRGTSRPSGGDLPDADGIRTPVSGAARLFGALLAIDTPASPGARQCHQRAAARSHVAWIDAPGTSHHRAGIHCGWVRPHAIYPCGPTSRPSQCRDCMACSCDASR